MRKDEWNTVCLGNRFHHVCHVMYAPRCVLRSECHEQYQADPGESHWTAVKNILKYLKRTKEMFLFYGGEEELVVSGYTDASFQTDHDDYRSQSGFVFTLNRGAVS